MQIFKKKSNKGFTLIELIVVMAVLAILVLLAVPKLLNYTKEAQAVQIKNDVKVVENVIEEYLIRSNDELPKGLDEVTSLEKDLIDGKVHDITGQVSSVKSDSFHIVTDMKEVKAIKSKLQGDFIANDSGKVYYIHTKAIGISTDGNGESVGEGCEVKQLKDFKADEMKPIDLSEIEEAYYYSDEENSMIPMPLDFYLGFIASNFPEGVLINTRAYERNNNKYIYINLSMDEMSWIYIYDVENMDALIYEEDAGGNSMGDGSYKPIYYHDLDENGDIDLNGCVRLFNKNENELINWSNPIKKLTRYGVWFENGDLVLADLIGAKFYNMIENVTNLGEYNDYISEYFYLKVNDGEWLFYNFDENTGEFVYENTALESETIMFEYEINDITDTPQNLLSGAEKSNIESTYSISINYALRYPGMDGDPDIYEGITTDGRSFEIINDQLFISKIKNNM